MFDYYMKWWLHSWETSTELLLSMAALQVSINNFIIQKFIASNPECLQQTETPSFMHEKWIACKPSVWDIKLTILPIDLVAYGIKYIPVDYSLYNVVREWFFAIDTSVWF